MLTTSNATAASPAPAGDQRHEGQEPVRNWGEITFASARKATAAAVMLVVKTASERSERRLVTQTHTIAAAPTIVVSVARSDASRPARSSEPGSPGTIVASTTPMESSASRIDPARLSPWRSRDACVQ